MMEKSQTSWSRDQVYGDLCLQHGRLSEALGDQSGGFWEDKNKFFGKGFLQVHKYKAENPEVNKYDDTS